MYKYTYIYYMSGLKKIRSFYTAEPDTNKATSKFNKQFNNADPFFLYEIEVIK